MLPIHDILRRIDQMSIAELEYQFQVRDQIVLGMREEMAALTPHLDQKWRQSIKAGPAHLAQSIGNISGELKLG